MDLNLEFAKIYDLISQKLTLWFEQGFLILPNILLALLIFAFFGYLAKVISKGSELAFQRTIKNLALAKFLTVVIKFSTVLLGFIVAINILNLDKAVTSILAGIGILGFALGFALQDMTANLVSGIALVVKDDYPFKVGDFIRSGDYQGDVIGIDLRSTSLKTLDGQHVIIPNKQIYENPITNYSSLGTRRVDLAVGVSYADNLENVEKVVKNAIKDTPNLDKSKEPVVFFEEFADSSINFKVFLWVHFKDKVEHLVARDYMIKAIHKAFGDKDITIPFPIRTMDFGIKGGEKLSEMQMLEVKN